MKSFVFLFGLVVIIAYIDSVAAGHKRCCHKHHTSESGGGNKGGISLPVFDHLLLVLYQVIQKIVESFKRPSRLPYVGLGGLVGSALTGVYGLVVPLLGGGAPPFT